MGNRFPCLGPGHPKLDPGVDWGPLSRAVGHGFNLVFLVVVHCNMLGRLKSFILNQTHLGLEFTNSAFVERITNTMVQATTSLSS